QSMPSRSSAASTRSPLSSFPGGPPSGPASATLAPSRAAATAALAAQPPLMTKKSCAWALPSGSGKRSTRNTSSSTMMPAHKIAGVRPLAELNLLLHPGKDDVVGDGDRWRRGQPIGVFAEQHLRHLVACKPTRILELGSIDDNVPG